jgi:GNAT superfamily N-acetyltransferase
MFLDLGEYSETLLRKHLKVYRRWAAPRFRSGLLKGWAWESPSGELVSSGMLWLQEGRPHPLLGPGRQPYILSMYTTPQYRRLGLSAQIVSNMLLWARTHGYRRVSLHASTMGRPVYAGLGFVDGPEMRFNLLPANRDASVEAASQPIGL